MPVKSFQNEVRIAEGGYGEEIISRKMGWRRVGTEEVLGDGLWVPWNQDGYFRPGRGPV